MGIAVRFLPGFSLAISPGLASSHSLASGLSPARSLGLHSARPAVSSSYSGFASKKDLKKDPSFASKKDPTFSSKRDLSFASKKALEARGEGEKKEKVTTHMLITCNFPISCKLPQLLPSNPQN